MYQDKMEEVKVPVEQMNQEDSVAYAKKLERYFPGALGEEEFIRQASDMLLELNFTPDSSINLVSNCRDELCRTFVETLDKDWGCSFNISSLGGMVFCGKTGFKAAMAHSPIVEGKERYVIWVAPHVAIPLNGEDGHVFRPGREGVSTACGALLGLLGEVKSGKLSVELNTDDIEQSMLKSKIVAQLSYGHNPDLVEITYAAHKVILADVIKTAHQAVDLSKSEFVIISGIQVHGPCGQNFFWPGTMSHYNKDTTVDLYDRFHQQVCEWRIREGGTALSHLQDEEELAILAAHAGKLDELIKMENSDLGLVQDHVGQTVLHIAARQGHGHVVKYLISKISKWPGLIEAIDQEGRTALEYAVEKGHDDAAGAIWNYSNPLSGQWLNNAMVEAVQEGKVGEITRLCSYGKRQSAIHACDREGNTLTDLAVKSQHPRRLEMLHELKTVGCDVPADQMHASPMMGTHLTNTTAASAAPTIPAAATPSPMYSAPVSYAPPPAPVQAPGTFALTKEDLIEILKANNAARTEAQQPEQPQKQPARQQPAPQPQPQQPVPVNNVAKPKSIDAVTIWSMMVATLLVGILAFHAAVGTGPALALFTTLQASAPSASTTFTTTKVPEATANSTSGFSDTAPKPASYESKYPADASAAAGAAGTEQCECPALSSNATAEIQDLKSQIKAYEDQEEIVSHSRDVLKQQLTSALAQVDGEGAIVMKLSPKVLSLRGK
eukprot:CAMPEP_0184305864 /NCGR_PEP_ID=MMETSP1049-20130417/15026_1 /TAXON_ID=77928 /ORGANISM="Proteomonas sulcata, Strain CCMP704" /LENGTH=722 /DNA_ID=CAMNT_0026618017 /DNA_START=195 /DNA_END=2363 /DNA_ORIENTATION=-